MAEKKEVMEEERVNPMFVTDTKTGERYELDFSRDSVRFAERREFDISNVSTYPSTMVPELFFLAFRKNHKNVARSKTDELLEELGGLTPEQIARLILLYNQAGYSNVIKQEETETKNATVTVEM